MARKAKEKSVAEPKDGRTPAERFEWLLKRVIAVPKAELERREKEYQRGRSKKMGVIGISRPAAS